MTAKLALGVFIGAALAKSWLNLMGYDMPPVEVLQWGAQ